MPRLSAHSLFDGALTCIADVRCRVPASPCGHEEHARAHELIFTRAGAFVKHTAAGARREVVAEPLHVLCLNQDEPYRVSHPADGGDDCTVLEFPADTVLDVVTTLDPRAADHPARPFRITHAPLTPEVLLRFRALRRTLRTGAADGAADPLAIEDEALAVLEAVLRDGYRAHGAQARDAHSPRRRPGTARDQRDLVERTKETLAAHPGTARSLSTLAREVHSSPYHLTRVFRAHVGVPVHRYLLRLRLALALERIEEGERNLSTVALALGFSGHSHFTAAFHRTFGVAPTAAVGRARELRRAGALRGNLEG
jgi:AraC-like DNA-binding protein